ncbi:hypothetical protein N7522_012856 [Penicillium canescens]|nr:hypothetical protein N7522_012856 [Penicillium canescens]
MLQGIQQDAAQCNLLYWLYVVYGDGAYPSFPISSFTRATGSPNTQFVCLFYGDTPARGPPEYEYPGYTLHASPNRLGRVFASLLDAICRIGSAG